MKNRVLQRKIILFTVLLLLMSSMALPVSANVQTVQYVALGDSLAAGQTPFKEIDKGFSGIVAENLEALGLLGSYSNEFAVSGYTTKNVLDDLVNNVEKNGKRIQDSIKQANVITVTAGANDFLRAATIDIEKGTLSIEPQAVVQVAMNINQNLSQTLKEIKTLAPEAKVFVFGYYNAFPYLSKEQQPLVKQALQAMNGSIQLAAVEAGATYVSLDGIFDADVQAALPNPTDIHPSLAGYEKIAEAFMKAYTAKPAPTFEDVSETNWAAPYIQFLAGHNVMNGVSLTHFGPNQSMTRGETAQALMNLLTLDMSMPPNPGFKDVSEDHPYYLAIAKLTQVGLFAKADAFNPDAPLTRAQMAKVLTKALNLEATTSSSFTDVSDTHWAKSYIDALVSQDITTGYPDQTFKPSKETSRAEFAAFLARAMQKKMF